MSAIDLLRRPSTCGARARSQATTPRPSRRLASTSSPSATAFDDDFVPQHEPTKWSDILPIPQRLPLHRYIASLSRRLLKAAAAKGAGRADDAPDTRVLLVAAGEKSAAQALRILVETVRRGERSLGFSAIYSVAIVQEDAEGARVCRGEVRHASLSTALGRAGGGAAEAIAQQQRGVPLPPLGRRRPERRPPQDDEEEDDENYWEDEDEADDDHEPFGFGALLEQRRQNALDAPLAQRRRDPSLSLPPKIREAAAAERERAEKAAASLWDGADGGRAPEKDDVFCLYVWGVPFSRAADDDGEERGAGGGSVPGAITASARASPYKLAQRIDREVARQGHATVEAAHGSAAARVLRAVALASKSGGAGGGGGLGVHVAGFAAPDPVGWGRLGPGGRPPPMLRLVRFTVVGVPAAWW
jgi:hypothetical protein